MKSIKRILTGSVFTMTIAAALLASGGDAYAKNRAGGGNGHEKAYQPDVTAPTGPVIVADTFEALGVTWEE